MHELTFHALKQRLILLILFPAEAGSLLGLLLDLPAVTIITWYHLKGLLNELSLENQ